MPSAVQQDVGDAAPTVAGADPDAPHRPRVLVVDVRDLGRAGERQVGARRDRGPPDDLVAVVGEDAFSLAGMRWLRHQQTLDEGFWGPTMVRTSSKRACVAGWTVSPSVRARGVVAMAPR